MNQLFPFQFRDRRKPVVERKKMAMWGKIIIACIPAAVVGVLFDSTFEALFYHAVPVAMALIVFGIAFIVIENRNKGRQPKITSVDQITVNTALIIGIFQLIAAVFPGTSRSGATIVGALLIGVSRTVAAEFTFYLAVPVMLGAGLLRVLQYGLAFTGMELAVLGADDYVVKPFSPVELVARVKAHIRIHRSLKPEEEERCLRAGNLEIWPDSYIVYKDGAPVALTSLEFEILVFFAQHPNIVFSRERLFDRIWGMEAVGDMSTVTVHVNKLREKIEDDPSEPKLIRTVWGVGYRFQG